MKITPRGWTVIAVLPLLLGIVTGALGFYWGQA